MENYSGDAEFQKFLEATSYIQQYTGVLLRRNDVRSPKILEHLSSISQLIELVKQLLNEQRDLTKQVQTIHSKQRNINSLIREKFVNLPSTSTNQNRRQQLDTNLPHQNFDLELILGRIQSNFGVVDQQQYRNQPQNLGPHENGNFQNLLDPSQLFEGSSSSPPNANSSRQNLKNGKSKTRVINQLPIGPYQCQHCEKSFRQKHGLTQHSLTHEQNGAFECDGCGKRYSRQESVYRHQRSTQCCPKYHSLTNARLNDGSSSDPKNISLTSSGFLM